MTVIAVYGDPYDWQPGDTITQERMNAMQGNIKYLQTPNQTRLSAGTTTNTTSASYVDITGATITRITNARTVDIEFSGSIAAGAAATLFVTLLIDGVNQGDALTGITGALFGAAGGGNFSFPFRSDVLTAASHTFKLQWKTNASTITLNAGWSFAVIER